MNDDPVRAFLRGRRCARHVVDGGLEWLVKAWEGLAEEVEGGYDAGLEDYLNDLDLRQILAEAMAAVAAEEWAAERPRVQAADARFQAASAPRPSCLWGERAERERGWNAAANWWYYRIPRRPGPALAKALGRAAGQP